jgi:hypothetical protein
LKQNIDRISIQVGLSGYSFKIESDNGLHSSDWLSADRVFTTPEFLKRYDKVDLAVFTPKASLVPTQFFSPEVAKKLLSEVVSLKDDEVVESVPVPEYNAVLVYSNNIGETLTRVVSETVLCTDGSKAHPLPVMYHMLKALPGLPDYNKILAAYMDGVLYLALAQGATLLLCNSFKAPDFTTAQYFIFLALKRLQLNPEMSTITFMTSLDYEQEMSLYRYFRSVEHI